MEKNKNKVDINKILKPSVKLNILFNNILDKISFNTYGSDNSRTKEINKLNKEIDSIINKEIDILSSFNGDDISSFLVKLFNKNDNKNIEIQKSIEGMFADDSNGIYEFFQDRYKNENLLIDDLNVICSNLYELNEAVLATRDAIITSDDISNTISRSIKFNYTEKDENTSYIQIIENMEKKFKLNSKLKNHIIPKTLQYGKYYVYTVPYSKLFENYSKELNKNVRIENVITEGFVNDFKEKYKIHDSKLMNIIKDCTKDIEVCKNDMPIPILEEFNLLESSDNTIDYNSVFGDESFNKLIKKNINTKNNKFYSDGTNPTKYEKFEQIKGCYIKLLDPTKIKPIKILDQTIGYLYIHIKDLPVEKPPLTSRINLMNRSLTGSKNMENNFLSKITDKIVKSFDKKFLEKNVKFKELIMNSLLFNDIYKKKIKFQFIPIDYITEFKVNTNEEDEGTSILLPSLFYAKLYLSLLLFKMISIITKSNDTKIYYVKSSGIDTNIVNKLQEIVRGIKSRQINFLELMNYNSMISKIGQNREIFMPVGQSGERGIDFDILSGQDIQLNTDLMEMLRTAFINGTGVPSVIMNYINEADYSRTLVMANTKFIGRVVSHQMDFNEPITELYKKILRYTTELNEELIDSLEYTLSTPRYLNNINMNDIISNIDNIINFMSRIYIGENNTNESTNKIKDFMIKELGKDMSPMLPWEKLEEIYKIARLKYEEEKISNKENTEEM